MNRRTLIKEIRTVGGWICEEFSDRSRLYQAVKYIRTHAITKKYTDMELWRFFPAPPMKASELRKQKEFVTGRTYMQSWSLNPEDIFLNYYSISNESRWNQIPNFVTVCADIPKDYILLDIYNDLIPFVYELDSSWISKEEQRDLLWMLEYHVDEYEVLVKLKEKKVKVKTVLCD